MPRPNNFASDPVNTGGPGKPYCPQCGAVSADERAQRCAACGSRLARDSRDVERERVARRFRAAASVELQERRLAALRDLGVLARGLDYQHVPADAIGMAAPDLVRIDLGNMQTRLVSKQVYTKLVEAGLL